MSFKGLGSELFEQAANRVAVSSQTALFDYHVALLVELAQHGMKKTLRFEIGPQFEPVHGKRVMIGCLVVIGEGVEILTAVLLDDLAKLVGHDVLVGRGDCVFPCLFEFLQLGLIAAYRFLSRSVM